MTTRKRLIPIAVSGVCIYGLYRMDVFHDKGNQMDREWEAHFAKQDAALDRVYQLRDLHPNKKIDELYVLADMPTTTPYEKWDRYWNGRK